MRVTTGSDSPPASGRVILSADDRCRTQILSVFGVHQLLSSKPSPNEIKLLDRVISRMDTDRRMDKPLAYF